MTCNIRTLDEGGMNWGSMMDLSRSDAITSCW